MNWSFFIKHQIDPDYLQRYAPHGQKSSGFSGVIQATKRPLLEIAPKSRAMRKYSGLEAGLGEVW